MGATHSLHPTGQTLQAYALGRLDDAAADAVHEHLEGCSECRRRMAETSSDSFLGGLRAAAGSAGAGTSRPAATEPTAFEPKPNPPPTQTQGPSVAASDGGELPAEPNPPTAGRTRRRWATPALAAGLVIAGLFAVLGFGAWRIETREGRIELEGVPRQCEVFVDGKKVVVSWPQGGGPLEIAVAPGERGVEVRKDGLVV